MRPQKKSAARCWHRQGRLLTPRRFGCCLFVVASTIAVLAAQPRRAARPAAVLAVVSAAPAPTTTR
jgi:hypothetical protein